MKNIPHTVYEILRETFSVVPEKSEEEIYKLDKGGGDKPKSTLLSGQWMEGTDGNSMWWYPNGEKKSLLGDTDKETLKFSLEYQEELVNCGSLFLGEEDPTGDWESPLLRIDSFPDTSEVTDMSGMFSCCLSLKSVNLENIKTSKVTDMRQMFWDCESLEEVDVSNFDTSNVTDMSEMFSLCSSLSSLNVSGFNTSKVTDMSNIFNSCSKLNSLDVSRFDTSSVTNMYGMFSGCANLKKIDVSHFNTSKVTSMIKMFSYCEKVEELDLSKFDTSEVERLDYIFSCCGSLKSLDLSSFDTTKVTHIGRMFYDCPSLETLNLRGWNLSEVKQSKNTSKDFISYCPSLKNIIGPIRGIKVNIDISGSPLLTKDSAMTLIEGLEDIGEERQIIFSQDTYNSLTPEEIEIATLKGWTVACK